MPKAPPKTMNVFNQISISDSTGGRLASIGGTEATAALPANPISLCRQEVSCHIVSYSATTSSNVCGAGGNVAEPATAIPLTVCNHV